MSNSDVYEELTQHIGQQVRQGAEAGAVIILVLLYRERNKMSCPLPPPKTYLLFENYFTKELY